MSKAGPLIKWTPESGWVAIVTATLPAGAVVKAMEYALGVYTQRLRGVPMGERRDQMTRAVARLRTMVERREACDQIIHAGPRNEVALFKGDAGFTSNKLISIGG